jgi:O-antigen/teichoic acid export membrane protein
LCGHERLTIFSSAILQTGMFNSIIGSLVTRICVAVINFIILFVSARYLGVSSRGEISIFLLNLVIIQGINEVFTGYSLIYFIPRYNMKKIIVTGLIYTLITCTLANAVLLNLNKLVPGFEPVTFVVTLLVMLNTFNCVLLLGRQRLRAFNVLSVIQPVLLLAGLLICISLLKIFTFKAYVYPLLVSFAIASVISSSLVMRVPAPELRLSGFALKPVFINGIIYQSTILIFILGNRYSYYLLDGSSSVGLYSSASSLVEVVLVIAGSIAPVLLANVANRPSESEGAMLALGLAKISFFFSVVALIIMWFIPDGAFTFMLGNGFRGIKTIMMMYSPAVLLASFFLPLCNFFSARGRQRKVLMCYIPGFISTLLVTPVMVNRAGIYGAALAADIVFCLHAGFITYSFIRSNNIAFTDLISLRPNFPLIRQLANPGTR